MDRRRLPLGIQTLRKIREDDCYYVDKTADILRLTEAGSHYFLSRPRRFGKSLLIDTMKELFEGNEPLFRGLAVHDCWDWSVRHPVLHLSFGSGSFADPSQVAASVSEQLDAVERDNELDVRQTTPAGRLRSVLKELHRKTGQRAAVLVDEYDRPILDAMFSQRPGDGPDSTTPAMNDAARANRDFLRGFYAAIKDADAHIRFSFLAGVTKFSKVSLFSGLNNLNDVTLDPRYGAIYGYTQHDLETVFAPELAGLDIEAIQRWYNGYHWAGGERMYNPFGVLMLLERREFGAWWFETGSPSFLVETLVRRRVASAALDQTITSEDLLSAFDVDHIATEALLFQTGYLTIVEEIVEGARKSYRLGYPNLEVRLSLNEHLLRRLHPDPSTVSRNQSKLHRLLETNDVAGLEQLFHSFFAGIPHQWHTNNDIADYEGYYASVFYSYFAALGLDVNVEESTSLGRLDMAARAGGRVYIFEFKAVEQAGPGAALAQLKQRRYADRYRAGGEPIHLVGVEFSSVERNIERFETEEA
ncbi:MAG: ATP-binding protein [Acidimicrobiaceae bacterium]|nr:ATP-binding protein [Acidimicrobiaceae bacterium]